MRIIGAVLVTALWVLLTGCGSPEKGAGEVAGVGKATKGGRVFLTVDFHEGQTLRYKFTSTRKIAIDWDPNAAENANRVQEQSEDFEMVVAYTPVEVDPYGVSTIRAVVESVKTVRAGGPASRDFGTDAVQTAQGKTFMLKVDSRGKITDSSELTALIQEMGKRAFRADTSSGRTKEPDMIGDFIASQWFLWDAQSSVERPANGVGVGQTWPSQLSVPTPMVMRQSRSVVYTLAEVRRSVAQPRGGGVPPLGDKAKMASPRGGATGPLAVIRSTYMLADSTPAGWPIPYSGKFLMSGTFGFLGPYEILGLEGSGEELFDLKAGQVERRQEKYTLRMKAGLPPLGIKANPHITIDQTLTMELQ